MELRRNNVGARMNIERVKDSVTKHDALVEHRKFNVDRLEGDIGRVVQRGSERCVDERPVTVLPTPRNGEIVQRGTVVEGIESAHGSRNVDRDTRDGNVADRSTGDDIGGAF